MSLSRESFSPFATSQPNNEPTKAQSITVNHYQTHKSPYSPPMEPSSSSLPPYTQPGSKLLPLDQIPSCPPNTRVRFLGCIASYDMTTAELSLSRPPSSVFIKTDVSLLTSSLSMGSLRDGEWVNVIGDTQKEEKGEGVLVMAITLWSAGGINLGKYEKGVKGRLEADALG